MENYLRELGDTKNPIVVSKLGKLADPSREEAEVFKREWPGIDATRRREIVERLVELAEDNFDMDFDIVFSICLHDADSEVKIKAIEGLAECEEHSLIDPFIALLQGDAQSSVRAAAATGLGAFALLAEFEELPVADANKVEKALMDAYNNKDEQREVRFRALEAISALSRPQVEEGIRQAYQSGDAEFKASAIFAMGRNCNRNWLPILLKELRNTDSQMRFEAARACGELEAEEAVPKLIELIQDSDSEVRLAAITSLGKIGGSRAKEALNECRDSQDELISEAAQDALEEMKFWEEPFAL
jgi:HEAT repeat protein